MRRFVIITHSSGSLVVDLVMEKLTKVSLHYGVKIIINLAPPKDTPSQARLSSQLSK